MAGRVAWADRREHNLPGLEMSHAHVPRVENKFEVIQTVPRLDRRVPGSRETLRQRSHDAVGPKSVVESVVDNKGVTSSEHGVTLVNNPQRKQNARAGAGMEAEAMPAASASCEPLSARFSRHIWLTRA